GGDDKPGIPRIPYPQCLRDARIDFEAPPNDHDVRYRLDKAAPSPHTDIMSPYSGLNPILSQLRDHLGFRRMECGMQTLSAHASAFASLDAAQPNAGVL